METSLIYMHQCNHLKIPFQDHFRKLSRTKLPRRQPLEAVKPELLLRRHAGILGLSACVQAFPYDVPDFMPQLLMELSNHLDDPQPIQVRYVELFQLMIRKIYQKISSLQVTGTFPFVLSNH